MQEPIPGFMNMEVQEPQVQEAPLFKEPAAVVTESVVAEATEESLPEQEGQMKKVKGIEKWITGYKEVRTYADELQLAFDFYHDDMVTEEEVDEDYAKAIKATKPTPLFQ